MDRLSQLREQLDAIGAATHIPLQDRSHDLATVAGDYAVELLRCGRQRSDQIDPPPSYNETVNAATVCRTEDGVPSSTSLEDPRRHASNRSTSPAQQNAASSSQTTILQAAQSTEVTPEESIYTTEQREIRRQKATTVISYVLREIRESQPSVEVTPPITNPRPHSTGSSAVGGSNDDYHSDTALLVFQRERIDKLERETGIQARTIESLHRKVNLRDETIEKNAAHVKLLVALVKEKDDLLLYEWSKVSLCCMM